MSSVLETRENPSSADGQSEFHPLPQIHDKEEEFNEKSEHDSGINEEPLLTADQVGASPWFWGFFCFGFFDREKVEENILVTYIEGRRKMCG